MYHCLMHMFIKLNIYIYIYILTLRFNPKQQTYIFQTVIKLDYTAILLYFNKIPCVLIFYELILINILKDIDQTDLHRS